MYVCIYDLFPIGTVSQAISRQRRIDSDSVLCQVLQSCLQYDSVQRPRAHVVRVQLDVASLPVGTPWLPSVSSTGRITDSSAGRITDSSAQSQIALARDASEQGASSLCVSVHGESVEATMQDSSCRPSKMVKLSPATDAAAAPSSRSKQCECSANCGRSLCRGRLVQHKRDAELRVCDGVAVDGSKFCVWFDQSFRARHSRPLDSLERIISNNEQNNLAIMTSFF